MAGKASQIDVETVRAANAVLGIGAAPDLSAPLAALTARVAALEASAPFFWVVFDGTFAPGPSRIASSAACSITRLAPGSYRIVFPPYIGGTDYGATFGAVGSPVQELARTAASIDIETPEGEVGTFITVALFGPTA